MTSPLNGSEAGSDLVLIQTSLLLLCKSSCFNANYVLLHDKSREVCIKARSTPASLPFKGQVTEQTTVKWSVDRFIYFKNLIENYSFKITNAQTCGMSLNTICCPNCTNCSVLCFSSVIVAHCVNILQKLQE